MNLHSIILSLFLQHDSGASMGGRQIPSIVSVWAEQYERFLVFSKATQSEMLHFATCQELLRLAKAWFWDMKPLFTAFKWSTAMLSFSIYRFVSKPRLCHPDVAGPEGEDFYNFRCLAHPLHRLYPETARERERARENGAGEMCISIMWGDLHFAERRVGAAFRSGKAEGLWCSDWVAASKTWNDWPLEINFCKFCLSKRSTVCLLS